MQREAAPGWSAHASTEIGTSFPLAAFTLVSCPSLPAAQEGANLLYEIFAVPDAGVESRGCLF